MTEDDEFQLLERKLLKEGRMYPPLTAVDFKDMARAHEAYKEDIEERRLSIEHEVKTASAKQVGGDHYKKMGIQTWDVVDTWSREQRIGYYRGNALKYIMRLGAKDEEIQETGKGIHYLEKLLEVLKEKL
jgi:hypothetical protein